MYVGSTFDVDSLIFTQEDPDSGYYDDNMNWVASSVELDPIRGLLQPFAGTDRKQMTLPAGIRAEDVWLFTTRDGSIKAAEEVSQQLAAKTTIGNREYYVQRKGDWSRIGIHSKHYSYMLVLMPRDTGVSTT